MPRGKVVRKDKLLVIISMSKTFDEICEKSGLNKDALYQRARYDPEVKHALKYVKRSERRAKSNKVQTRVGDGYLTKLSKKGDIEEEIHTAIAYWLEELGEVERRRYRLRRLEYD